MTSFTKLGTTGGWTFTVGGHEYVAIRNEAGFRGRDWMLLSTTDPLIYQDMFASRAEVVAWVEDEHQDGRAITSEHMYAGDDHCRGCYDFMHDTSAGVEL